MGMTQKEFGEIIGVKQQTVCKYERVNTNVSLEVLQKISDAFGVKVEEMIEDNLERYIQSGNRRNISLEIEKDIINRVRKLNGKENLVKVMNSTVTKLNGEERLQSIDVTDKNTGETKTLNVDALFVAIGQIPMNQIFSEIVELDEYGFIKADEECRTSVKGIYAAGDCRVKSVRQLTTAASDGAIAALNACNNL